MRLVRTLVLGAALLFVVACSQSGRRIIYVSDYIPEAADAPDSIRAFESAIADAVSVKGSTLVLPDCKFGLGFGFSVSGARDLVIDGNGTSVPGIEISSSRNVTVENTVLRGEVSSSDSRGVVLRNNFQVGRDDIVYPDPSSLQGNPLVTSIYTADPSAHVFGDTLYVYPSHDEEIGKGFNMKDYHCFSTVDMVHFEDRGVIFSPFEQTSWAKEQAWAPDCVERNGKYYLYYPTDTRHIGVAVSDSPTGPFVDPLGNPLLSIDSPGVLCDRDFIDPAVFVDDDGQAYMFVGQNTMCCIKLNEDMISYDGQVHIIEGLHEFFEASWMHKYNGKYYLSYSNSPFTGHRTQIAYAMSDNPLGPYEYKGIVLDPVSCGTNHHSIVEFQGQWYIFYHTADLSRNRKLHPSRKPSVCRSICADKLYYNDDGTIQKVHKTRNALKINAK